MDARTGAQVEGRKYATSKKSFWCDFSKIMQSYINIFRDNFSRIKNVQISNIIKHYESKLLSIKNRIEEVEYSKKAKHETGTDLAF